MAVDQSSRFMCNVPTAAGAALWAAGSAAFFAMFWLLAGRVVNVVNYGVMELESAPARLIFWAPGVAFVALLTVCVCPCAEVRGPESELESLRRQVQRATWTVRSRLLLAGFPLLAPIAVLCLWLIGTSPTFLTVCVGFVGFFWALDRLGRRVQVPRVCRHAERCAPVFLALAILVTTAWHTAEQVCLWRHLMLGYADFGLFIIELEHCLPWKDVGPTRFSDTRMGYHAVWMFYLLAPFYALVRSPVFLMIVGPLVLNLAAAPFYQLARERSGSRIVGLLVGLAWLALPSVSRLPYANTYGFQSIYLAVPWLAWAFALGVRGRWRWSHVCLAAAQLCEETVCGVALGWGVFLMVWGGRRRDGAWIAGVSVAYLLTCALVVIPFFAESSQYTRLGLFGEVTAGGTWQRVLRPRVGLYLLALAAPLLPGLVRGWRVLLAAAPTLLLVALLQNGDYLNIKYWHQSSVLPVLFLAATLGVTRVSLGARSAVAAPSGLGPALALLVGVLCFHQAMGFSPLTRPHYQFARQDALQGPDPRMEVVDYVRARFVPERATVIATERMAAHFTDYRSVSTVRNIPHPDPAGFPQVLVIDRCDDWDPMIRSEKQDGFLTEARAAGFTTLHSEGPVLVLARARAR